ncbi:MAG: hypothetical protein KF760_27540 [Candidatus Eremiobacteraeota bacterium]|nr:hypothetical protein [Candidatus Eremiobacteraeota bacterium]MCW5872261.1 hypothetical protein [Candidatus Eremiobacteraeota bacterium]
MSSQPDPQELQLRQQRALHVFQEMLTAVNPEVRSALESLYDLVRADQALLMHNLPR